MTAYALIILELLVVIAIIAIAFIVAAARGLTSASHREQAHRQASAPSGARQDGAAPLSRSRPPVETPHAPRCRGRGAPTVGQRRLRLRPVVALAHRETEG